MDTDYHKHTGLASSWMLKCEIVIITGIFLLIFAPTFSWMWKRMTASGTFYSHGPLIPLLALFLVWQRSSRLREISLRPSTAGIAIVIAGLFLHLISMVSDIHFLSGFAMIIVLFGVSIYLFGGQVTRQVSPALALLLFMIPVPRVFLIDTAFFMQVTSAKATAAVLCVLGFDVVREGVYLTLGGSHIFEVAYPCSGLRSLIVFIATAWIIIALAPRIDVKRCIPFMLLSIPVALASNVFRLVVTAIAGIYSGYSNLIHTASGIIAFVIYVTVMITIGKRLLWREDSSR